MDRGFTHCLQIFPTADFQKTIEFYERIGFRAVAYLDSGEPHVCLYQDSIEIVLSSRRLKSCRIGFVMATDMMRILLLVISTKFRKI